MIGKIPSIQSSQAQAIGATQAVGRQSAGETSGGNPFSAGAGLFAGNTSGLSNMQTGDSVYTPAQAGKPAGISRMLGIG